MPDPVSPTARRRHPTLIGRDRRAIKRKALEIDKARPLISATNPRGFGINPADFSDRARRFQQSILRTFGFRPVGRRSDPPPGLPAVLPIQEEQSWPLTCSSL